MTQLTKLAAVLNGLVQNTDLTSYELVVSSLRTGSTSGNLLTDTILGRLISLQNGTDVDATYHTHDGRYFTETELGSSSSSSGSDLIGDDNTYSNSTPTAATVKGALSGIDTALGATFSKDGSRTATGNFNLGGFKITNLGTPTANSDAATKSYVDAAINGLDWKQSVKAATTTNIDLSSMPTTVDGVTLSGLDRFLAKNQTNAYENGIYVYDTDGEPATRATDADSSAEVTAGLAVFVEEGTVNADSGWVLTTNDIISLDTTDLTFAQFTGTGSIVAGAGLTKTGNTLDVGAGDGIQVDADSVTVKLDGSTLSKSGSGLKVADAGITGTQLNASVAGAGLAGGAGSALSVNVDDSTIEINSDTLRVKDAGITLAKLASNSVDENKLTTSVAGNGLAGGGGAALSVNVDGSTLEINTDALRIKDAGVTLAKLAADSVDENKIKSSSHDGSLTGGSGTVLSVNYAPQAKKTMVAGEAFAANTSFLVRMAVNGETAGRIYKADQTSAASAGKFWVIGIALSTSAVSSGQNIDVTLLGTHTLGSSDTAFGGTDIGKAVWLSSSTGAFSVTAPSTLGEACFKVGTVETTTKIWVNGQFTAIA